MATAIDDVLLDALIPCTTAFNVAKYIVLLLYQPLSQRSHLWRGESSPVLVVAGLNSSSQVTLAPCYPQSHHGIPREVSVTHFSACFPVDGSLTLFFLVNLFFRVTGGRQDAALLIGAAIEKEGAKPRREPAHTAIAKISNAKVKNLKLTQTKGGLEVTFETHRGASWGVRHRETWFKEKTLELLERLQTLTERSIGKKSKPVQVRVLIDMQPEYDSYAKYMQSFTDFIEADEIPFLAYSHDNGRADIQSGQMYEREVVAKRWSFQSERALPTVVDTRPTPPPTKGDSLQDGRGD